MRRWVWTGVGMVAATLACTPGEDPAVPATPAAYQVMVFSRTEGFRHDSIPAGVEAIRALGAEAGFAVTATEDPGAFSTDELPRYAAVVFLNTTGDVLDPAQQAAFEGYVRGGGGFVGVHAAADTEYDWPFYGGLVGAYFARHPAVQPATIRVTDRSHPATAQLPAEWTRTDEWYDYRTIPGARILATLDETSYEGGGMGENHPHAWCHGYEGGRAFYTGGGHTAESYGEPAFRTHLSGAIEYAAGAAEADCDTP